MKLKELLKDLRESGDIKIDDEGIGKFSDKAKAALFDALNISEQVENTFEWIDICAEIAAEPRELFESLQLTDYKEQCVNTAREYNGGTL